MYKYDIHVHTNIGSKCGVWSPEELVRRYVEYGFSGVVITDHFMGGHTAVDLTLPWEEKFDIYYSAYLRAKKEAEKYDGFTVLFGAEYYFSGAKEMLIYGADRDFFLAHPELDGATGGRVAKVVRDSGYFACVAHPFRRRPYITDRTLTLFTEGAEVYNAHNKPDENQDAICFAKKYKKIMLSGGDMHLLESQMGLGGIATEEPIKDNAHFLEILRSGKYKLIIDGEIKNEV